jgi:ribonuclease D
LTHLWVDRQAVFDDLVADMARCPRLALDTEFHRERTFHPQVAVVQLAWEGAGEAMTIAVVDALAVDLRPLAPVLASDVEVVMHAAVQDIEVLQRSVGAVPERLFDTQLAAGFAGYATPSLANLVEGLLGVRLMKGDRLADWLRRPLGADQREYAASDVAHLFAVQDRLVATLERQGRLAWAEDECRNLLERSILPREPDEAWWRVKEARSLRGKAVGVAQALGAWRERRADEVDQPVRFVLPDLALVGIAQRPPADAKELRRVRGLDERHLRGGADRGILAAVQAGLALTSAELRVPVTADVGRDLRPAVALVSAWVSQLGRQLGIDPTLLGTRSDLEAFLRGDEGARLGTGWRAEAVGRPVRRLVDGEAALAFDGRGGLVIEARSHQPMTIQ